MKNNLGWMLVGFFMCLCVALSTAAIQWEPIFNKFGPLFEKAQIRAEVAEFNRIRQWDTDLKAAVAASSTFANLKTRIAGLPDRPQLTASNVYAEVMGYIEEYENE